MCNTEAGILLGQLCKVRDASHPPNSNDRPPLKMQFLFHHISRCHHHNSHRHNNFCEIKFWHHLYPCLYFMLIDVYEILKKLREKLWRYAPTKGNQAKTDRIIDIMAIGYYIDITITIRSPVGANKNYKGLFINDVIIFGGYRDPPPPPRHHLSLFGYPPSHVRVTCDKTDFATKQRMLAS